MNEWTTLSFDRQLTFTLLENTREEFFAKHQPLLLRIQYDVLKAEPERILADPFFQRGIHL